MTIVISNMWNLDPLCGWASFQVFNRLHGQIKHLCLGVLWWRRWFALKFGRNIPKHHPRSGKLPSQRWCLLNIQWRLDRNRSVCLSRLLARGVRPEDWKLPFGFVWTRKFGTSFFLVVKLFEEPARQSVNKTKSLSAVQKQR